jgi:hypothetical protein
VELIILLLLLLFLFIVQNRFNEKLILKISLLLLFIFSGFRVVTGKDDASYIKIFNLLQQDQIMMTEAMQEPIFILILKLLGFLFSYKSLFIFFSGLSIFLLYKACRRYTGYAILPVIIYFSHKYIHNDLNQIRQGIVSLVLLNIIDSKKIFDLKKILLSSGIHLLSFVFVPAKYFLKFKFNKVYNYLFLILICFAGSFYIKSEIFIDLFINNKFYTYFIDSRFNKSINLLSNINFYKTTLFVLFIFLNLKKYNNINKFNILFNTYFFGYLVLILFRNINIISGRLSSVFFITEPFIIYLLYRHSEKRYKLLFLLLIIMYVIFQIIYNLFLNSKSPIL